jgi:hypothetical protein
MVRSESRKKEMARFLIVLDKVVQLWSEIISSLLGQRKREKRGAQDVKMTKNPILEVLQPGFIQSLQAHPFSQECDPITL